MRQLTDEKAREIGNAFARYMELTESKLVLPGTEEEKQKLDQFLITSMRQYIPDLLGAFFAVRAEYEPLVNSLASLLNRVQSIIISRLPAQPAAPPKNDAAV